MRTADQVRLQLERCMDAGACSHCRQLIAVLHAVIPELIEENARLHRELQLSEASRGTPYDDAGARYRDRSVLLEHELKTSDHAASTDIRVRRFPVEVDARVQVGRD